VVSALFLNELPAVGAALESAKPPDRLVLRSRSSFSLRELSIDLGPKGLAESRYCAASNSFGGCKIPWKTNQRMLTSEERRILARLALEAKLFNGRANGAHVDLAFRWLEVRARSSIAMLVMEPGPRKELFARLYALEKDLAGPDES
jgi:hypothetical protein